MMVRSIVDIKLLSLLQISGHCCSAQDHAVVALAANWRNKGKQVSLESGETDLLNFDIFVR